MSTSIFDLKIFQLAVEFCKDTYALTRKLPREERFGLSQQLRRAAVSVVAQIAEGHGRLSWGEWRQFLSQARGSVFEVEAELFVCQSLGFLTEQEVLVMRKHAARLARGIESLVAWIKEQEKNRVERRPLARAKRAANAPDPITR